MMMIVISIMSIMSIMTMWSCATKMLSRFGIGAKQNCFEDTFRCEADLGCGGDSAGGDPHGVDASIGILVDFDVGLLFPGFEVSCRVEQVQHFLIVQLYVQKM